VEVLAAVLLIILLLATVILLISEPLLCLLVFLSYNGSVFLMEKINNPANDQVIEENNKCSKTNFNQGDE